MNSPKTPGTPQELLAVRRVKIVLQPAAPSARFEFALDSRVQTIEHARHRNERRGAFSLHGSNNLRRIRRLFEDYSRAQQRRHEQRHELSKYMAERNESDESKGMKPSLILSIGIDPAFERLEICQKIAMRQNDTARLSRRARSKKDLCDMISSDASSAKLIKGTGLTCPVVSGKSSSTSLGMAGSSAGFSREATISLTPASRATRPAKSSVAPSSMGTATAPRSKQPQKAAVHSAVFGPQSRTRSPVRTPRFFRLQCAGKGQYRASLSYVHASRR